LLSAAELDDEVVLIAAGDLARQILFAQESSRALLCELPVDTNTSRNACGISEDLMQTALRHARLMDKAGDARFASALVTERFAHAFRAVEGDLRATAAALSTRCAAPRR
jgi:hypothetical protein